MTLTLTPGELFGLLFVTAVLTGAVLGLIERRTK